jgi:dolichol-phosphate mannosyltransferase
MKERVYVLLPAFNESDALRVLVPSIGKAFQAGVDFTIVIVDDGSTDSTPQVCAQLSRDWPCQCLRHPSNQGYGAAVKTGVQWIVENGGDADSMVMMDADNTHLPKYIPSMLQKLKEDFDVVTASYRMPGGQMMGVPWKRALMSHMVNLLLKWRMGVRRTSSITNGFRAYRVAALQKAHERYGNSLVLTPGFPGGSELFLKVLSTGARDAEVPFTLHYENRLDQSKIRIFQTILAYLQLLKNARLG